jgi:hypothetical protein
MQDVHMQLNPELPCQSSIQQEEESFHQQTGRKFKEGTNEMLHLEHSFAGCLTWTLHRIDQKYIESLKLVLKNVGKDNFD